MFAQLMQEMLTDQNFESFRAFSLDTIARLDEALAVSEDIRRNRLPMRALEPVQCELVWSLSKDPAVADATRAEAASFAEFIKGSKVTINEVTQHLTFLKKRLNQNYKFLCEQKILALYANNESRVELRRATGFYCSHLLNTGYASTYILQCVKKAFFTSPVKRAGKPTLSKFFRVFDNTMQNFLICTAVNEDFARYLNDLNFSTYPSAASLPNNLSHGMTQLLPIGPNQAYMLSRETAYDENGAVAAVEAMLISARALAFVVPHKMNFEWDRPMYVAKMRSTHGVVLRGQMLPLQRVLVSSGAARRAIKNIKSYSSKVLNHFDEPSFGRILSSLRTSALARTSPSIENQLISLWSAVEVLLSEPPQGTARILHYTKLLLPCICLRYIRRQTVAVYNEMLVTYRKKFSAIVNAELNVADTDQHTRFAAILFLPNNEHLRLQLLNICSNNPLARHRLWKLHRDYSSPKAIKDALTGHAQRVEWQIHRIYRARNNLVHSGRNPSYLDSLVLNLDEYYRASFGTLVNRAGREDDESDIDQLVAEIGIEYNIYSRNMVELQKEESLSTESFLRIIS